MFVSNNSNDYVNRSRNICVANDHDYVPHVEQEPLNIWGHMILTGVRVVPCLVFCVVFCRSLVYFCPFVLLSLLMLLLYYLSFDLRLLITPLLSVSFCLLFIDTVWTDYDDNISMRVYVDMKFSAHHMAFLNILQTV
jgi:hypothetical protein